MNVELLQKVKEKLFAEPTAVSMNTWLRSPADTPCGTIGCIAGWAYMLAGGDPEPKDIETIVEYAVTKLDTKRKKNECLFYASDWPSDLRRALDQQCPGTPEYAAIVAARIDRFIETDGAE